MRMPIDPGAGPKILVAVTTIAIGGGAEKVAAMIANGLWQEGLNVRMLTQYGDPHEHAIQVPRDNLGMPLKDYYSLPVWRRRFTKIRRALARMLGTARVCHEYQIDTVISFLEESNFYIVCAKLLFRLPMRVIVSVRMDPRRYGRFYKVLMRILYRHADVVVAVTKGIEETLRSEFGLQNVTTIYNPIDISMIRELAAEPLPENAAQISGWEGYYVNAARLTYQKGQWHLLRAFKCLIEKQPEAKLVILGDGPDRNDLALLAERLGIAKSIFFAGQQDNIYPFLLRAKCFVLTSLWEGLPNVILEALALRLPVIAADSTSGMRELLAPELPLSASIPYPYTASRGVLVAPFPDEEASTRFLPKEGPYDMLADALAQPPRPEVGEAITEVFSPRTILAAWRALINP